MTLLAKKVAELCGKPELVTKIEKRQQAKPGSPSWSCPNCQGVVTLEKPDPSILPTCLWNCANCGAVGAISRGDVWVGSRTVH